MQDSPSVDNPKVDDDSALLTLLAIMYLVTIFVGVGAVTVTRGANVSPDLTVTGRGVSTTVAVASSGGYVRRKRRQAYPNSLPVTVAVMVDPVTKIVEVVHFWLSFSVTMRGCGSGALRSSPERAACLSRERAFRGNMSLASAAAGPTVGAITARGSNRAGLVGGVQVAV